MIRRLLLILFLLAAPVWATQAPHFFDIDFTDLVTPCPPGRIFGIKDALTKTNCGAGGGGLAVVCQCDADGLGYSVAGDLPVGGTYAFQLNGNVAAPLHTSESGLNFNKGTKVMEVPGQLQVSSAIDTNTMTLTMATGSADDTRQLQFVESGSGVLSSIEVDGDIYTQGNLGISVGDPQAANAACIFNDSDRLFHDTDCDEVKDGGEEYIDQAGGGTPGGADTEVQFNNSGSFEGDPDFTFDGTTLTLGEAGTSTGRYALEDASSNQTCMSPSVDRLFHDTDCDGVRDAGEEYLDNASGGGSNDIQVAGVGGSFDGESEFDYNDAVNLLSLTGYFIITGDDDLTQLTIKMDSGQTDNPFEIQNSGSSPYLTIDDNGALYTIQSIGVGGSSFAGSTCIHRDDPSDRMFHDQDCNGSKGAGELFMTKLVTADCSGVTTEGESCWDSDNDCLYVGDGSAAVQIGGTCS